MFRPAILALAITFASSGICDAQKSEAKAEQRQPTQAEKEAAGAAGVGGLLCIGVGICGGALLYFLPTLIAVLGSRPNAMSIFIINLFFGWSFIGWVLALAWSFSTTEDQRRYRRRYQD